MDEKISIHNFCAQQVLMQMQDAGLDALSETVMRLGDMSNNISEELGQQNKMLDAMETELDDAGDQLDIVTRSTKQLIAKSGGMSTFCLIAALSIVVLVLLFLIIYTWNKTKDLWFELATEWRLNKPAVI